MDLFKIVKLLWLNKAMNWAGFSFVIFRNFKLFEFRERAWGMGRLSFMFQ